MELNPKSRLVRFAYFFTPGDNHPNHTWGPKQTTLCAFFWRAFVLVPLAWLIIATWVGIAIFETIKHPLQALVVVMGAVILIGSTALIGIIQEHFRKRKELEREQKLLDYVNGVQRPTPDPTAFRVFLWWLKAKKRKFCPIIEFKTPEV